MQHSSVWVRIAGHVGRIRGNHPEHWRVFVGREGEEIPLVSWSLQGAVSAENFVHGSDATGANPLGLNAWIDAFGDVEIDNGRLIVSLQNPS